MRAQRRNPLFEIEGVQWDYLNMRAIAYDYVAAKRLADTLLAEGYQAGSVRWHDLAGVVTVSFHDIEGRHADREGGNNENVTMVCFQAEGFRGVGVVYKQGGQWHEFTNGGTSTTCGDSHIEERLFFCGKRHPDAKEIQTWDVELLGMPAD